MSRQAAPILAVGEVARYVRRAIESDEQLQHVVVSGELSNFKGVHANGNAYFDLKDDQALLNCVMWGSTGLRLPKDLANGMQVHAEGRLSTYPRRSAYQLVVEELRAVGRGDLHARYEELRERLQREGLFALERKRALPRYPRRIAVVTSPAAAAYADFLRTMRAHAAYVQVALVPTPVQGSEAAASIAAAIDRAGRLDVDAIAIIRGGGSFEDLFVFNEEAVVRAIVRARVPVVTGIGHESDVTLADFAADLREPTPTAAARAIAPSRQELLARIEHLHARLLRTRAAIVGERRQRVDYALSDLRTTTQRLVAGKRTRADMRDFMLERHSPSARLKLQRASVAALAGRLKLATQKTLFHSRDRIARVHPGALRVRLQRCAGRLSLLDSRVRDTQRIVLAGTRRLELCTAKLSALGPHAVLSRGYAILSVDSRVVRSADAAPPGTLVAGQLAHGRLEMRVERSEHGEGC